MTRARGATGLRAAGDLVLASRGFMAQMSNPIAGVTALAIDSADPPALASFWQRLLGGEIVVDGDGDAELNGGPVRLDFLLVPDSKHIKNRLHLDLRSDDYDAAVRYALGAGASLANDVAVLWPPRRAPLVLTVYLIGAPGAIELRNSAIAAVARAVAAAAG